MVVDMSFTKKVKTGTFFVTKILIITYIFFVNLKKTPVSERTGSTVHRKQDYMYIVFHLY